jgi:hypothetical protein
MSAYKDCRRDVDADSYVGKELRSVNLMRAEDMVLVYTKRWHEQQPVP